MSSQPPDRSGPAEPTGAPGPTAPDEAAPQPVGQPSWHDFGVPHSGPPEPTVYTPATRERLRPEPTTEILAPAPDEPATPSESAFGAEEVQPIPVVPAWSGDPWSSGPAADPWGSAPSAQPQYPAPGQGYPAYDPFGPTGPSQPLYGDSGPVLYGGPGVLPPYADQPVPPAEPRKPRRGRRVAGIVALALVCATLGGAVALAGARLLDRENTSLGSALPAPGPGSTSRPEGSVAKIAADALPSVVTIRIKTSQGTGTGSGFVIDKQGHILTNNHVTAAAGSGSQIQVELNNGTTLPATVVGADASYDLAVIKVNTTDLTPLEFGSSKDVVVGDGVIAVGAPLGLDATVTSGIVSALNRPVSAGDGTDTSFINAIQTDAAINPGNSGGPLLDMSGRVIGINSAIARVPGTTDSSRGNIGVGFAIPSDQAAKTAQQLITTGKAEHPALGVRVDRSYDGDGARIAAGGVTAGSAAAQAGLQAGDIVEDFQGRKVTDADALIVAIRSLSVGDTVQLKVKRGDQTIDVSMTLQSGG